MTEDVLTRELQTEMIDQTCLQNGANFQVEELCMRYKLVDEKPRRSFSYSRRMMNWLRALSSLHPSRSSLLQASKLSVRCHR